MAEFNMKLTNNGSALLAKALNEKELRFKYISLGKGVFVGNAEEVTQLTDKVIDLNIASKTRKDTVAILKAVLEYNAVPDGFTWTELGVVAVDPDTHEEILYMYAYSELGDLIPPSTSATQIEKVIQVATYVSNATNITATIDESLINIPKSDINKPDGVAGLNSSGVLDIRHGGTNASTEQQAIYNLGTGARQNLLDNWFFLDAGHGRRFPINQRGQTSYTGAVYGIDRWKGVYGGETVRVENDRVQVIVQNNQGIRQILEPMPWIRGNFVTLSILCAFSGNYAGCSCVIDGHFYDGISLSNTGISLHSKTFKLPDDFTNLSIDISGDGTIDVYAIKFEIGQVQSLATQQSDGRWVVFDRPDYTIELLKCRRYLVMGMMESLYILPGSTFLPLGVPMRIKPSIIGKPLVYEVETNSLQSHLTARQSEFFMYNGMYLYYGYHPKPCYIYFPHGTGLSAEL